LVSCAPIGYRRSLYPNGRVHNPPQAASLPHNHSPFIPKSALFADLGGCPSPGGIILELV
jgi:hypothetical protein